MKRELVFSHEEVVEALMPKARARLTGLPQDLDINVTANPGENGRFSITMEYEPVFECAVQSLTSKLIHGK